MSEMPERMKRLPRDHRGYPVPWFVQWVSADSERLTAYGEGRPLFQLVDTTKFARAHRERRCWVCGEVTGVRRAYVIGPIGTVNRVTAEPGCHLACAIYAACTCPFLTRPKMRRLPRPKMIGTKAPPGVAIERNPGVVCVWVTKTHHIVTTDRGPLIQLGPPEPAGVSWFRCGRPATRADVLEAITSGLPILRQLAAQDGPAATHALQRQIDEAMTRVPRY